jgi:hypothetical protein
MNKRTRVLLLLAATLIASREPPFVRSDAALPGARTEDDVLEAVFRHHIEELLDVEARRQGTVLCLAVDPGGAPQSVSREFLARFRGEPSVRRGAECEARPEGASTLSRPRPAIIVTAGPIDWVAADEAWVTASCFRSRESTRRWQYRVVREAEGWVSLGPIVKLAPA